MRIIARDLAAQIGERQLFGRINFAVDAGRSIALMGPSGVGKSTLLSIIAGYTRSSSGSLDIIGSSSEPPEIQWLMQSTPLLANRSAIDNVVLAARLRGIDPDAARDEALEALRNLGLASRAAEKVFKLSGGERQRVAVARTLLARAEIVLADEPTASLDPRSRDDVTAALNSIAQSGAIVVVATHDAEVAATCDETLTLTGEYVS